MSRGGIDVPAWRFAALGLALVLTTWCAGGRALHAPDRDGRAAPGSQPVVVRIDAATTFADYVEQTAALLGEPRMFVWGDVGELAGARAGSIAWSDGRIDGWFVRDPADLLRNPQIKALVIVTYDDGTLWGSHPSGDERWPLEIPDEPSDDRWGQLAVVVPDVDPSIPVLPIFRAVRGLPRLAQFSAL